MKRGATRADTTGGDPPKRKRKSHNVFDHPEALKRRGSTSRAKPAPPARPDALTSPRLPLPHTRTQWEALLKSLPGYDPFLLADGFRFDSRRARKAIDWIETNLHHVKGAMARRPLILQPWERAIVGNLFGWVNGDGARRFRSALVYVPRKNGKTTLAAALILYVLLCDGEYGAEIYGAAAEFKQACIVFDIAHMMVLLGHLETGMQILKGQNRAMQLGPDTGFTTYRVVGSVGDHAYGWNTHAAVVDELHAQATGNFLEALETSVGARTQPLLLYLTTADYGGAESPCNTIHQRAMRVRDGAEPDPTLLPVIYQAAPEDDWHSPDVWRRANPNLGVSVSLDYLERAHSKACRSAVYENTFKRLHLNIQTSQDVVWLRLSDWDACVGKLDFEQLRGVPCWAGLDLSATSDTTAMALVWALDGEAYACATYFWVPQECAQDRELNDRIPYAAWAAAGYVTFTPGTVTDYRWVRARIVELANTYDLREVAYDPWNAEQLAEALRSEDGVPMVMHRQGFVSMSEPSKTLERVLLSRTLLHDANPLMRWHVSNVKVDVDPAGNLKPNKSKSGGRIDGVVALVMGIGRAAHGRTQEAPYAGRDLRFV